ncbi:putative Spore gernimation protein [Candidatus Hydrogenisulfobacillus filiaventi]|uniref:Putative Spore gernimation protein n=1 Tax=Candidatus Hydrogenisulfobacillus filiaventi TaxID=2707344 RepID=A0A6F8ZFJ9_9FIRM|nr:putative Spore gernimation protein [Candidatus Hydrogenisulfobacillus filiaventi]
MGMTLAGVLLGGCTVSRAMNDRLPVIAVAVEPAGPTLYRWTLVFPNLATTASTLPQGSIASAPFFAARVTAPSLQRALTRAEAGRARALDPGQLLAVVFSPRLTCARLATLVTAFNTVGFLHPSFWMAAGPPQAVEERGPEAVAPEYPLDKYFSCVACHPLDTSIPGWKLWTETASPGMSPVLPLLSPAGDGPRVRQVVVFPARHPAVVMNPAETRGWAYLTGRVRRESLDLVWRGGRYTLVGVRSRVRRRVRWAAGVKQAHVAVRVVADQVQGPPGVAVTAAVLPALERQAAAAILRDCRRALAFAARTRTDPFGFGRDLDWQAGPGAAGLPAARLASAPIRAVVTVQVYLKSGGLTG